jgi:DNA repair ATPase RecN
MEYAESISSDILKEAKGKNALDLAEEVGDESESEMVEEQRSEKSSKDEDLPPALPISDENIPKKATVQIMSHADVEKILQIIKETDDEFREKELQLLDEIERKRKEENIKEMEKELKKQKKVQEKLKKENEKAQITSQMELLETKLVELEKYKYDPDCEYCLKNGEHQITHKTEIMESLTQKKKEILHIKSKYELIEIDFKRLLGIENKKQKYDLLSEDLKQIEGDAYKTHAKIKEMENEILGIEQILSKVYDDKELYEKNKSAIEYNEKINIKINFIEN